MNDNPLVSIIVPTVNCPQFTECIERIRSQTKVRYELIVVCDTPTYAKREQLHVLEEQGVKVIINEERMGNPGAQNIGMKAAGGDYIMLTQDDVLVWTDGWIQPLVTALQKHPEFGFTVPLVKRIRDQYIAFGELGEASLLSRELVDKVGYWDESDIFRRLACDGDYFVRIKNAGYRPHGVARSMVFHYLGSTVKDELEKKDLVDNMEELYRRYGKEEIWIDRRLLPVYHENEEMMPKWV